MPKLRHTSAIGSPSRSRATNRKRSSTTEHSFHGINTSRQRAKSVTHVSGTKCHPCLGPFSVSRRLPKELHVAPFAAVGLHNATNVRLLNADGVEVFNWGPDR